MITLSRKNLKRGVFRTPHAGDNHFEQYIIETLEDMVAFTESFEWIHPSMKKGMIKSLNKGSVVLANDEHPSSGHPTWRIESPQDATHPDSHIRVSLITENND